MSLSNLIWEQVTDAVSKPPAAGRKPQASAEAPHEMTMIVDGRDQGYCMELYRQTAAHYAFETYYDVLRKKPKAEHKWRRWFQGMYQKCIPFCVSCNGKFSTV